MANQIRWLLAWILIFALSPTCVLAQSTQQRPVEGKPIEFEGIRQRDRLAPTPQYTMLATGLYGRQIVQAASERGDYTVHVWSLLVSPRISTGDAKLPGAAVILLRSGRVELITGDQKTRLEPGVTASVPEGASLRFVNSDANRPAQLRAVVMSGNR